MKTLKDEAEPGESEPGQLAIRESVQPGSQNLDYPGRRLVDSPDQLEQGGLAATRRTHDRDIFTRPNLERHIPEGMYDLSVHRVVFTKTPANQHGPGVRAHVASSRNVAAIGARAASHAG